MSAKMGDTLELLQDRMMEAERVAAENIAKMLYDDGSLIPPRVPTFKERWKTRFARAHDAWLVLTGKLDPYGDC